MWRWPAGVTNLRSPQPATRHTAVDMATAISLLFVLAMLALIGGLLTFLREIHLAIASVRIGQR